MGQPFTVFWTKYGKDQIKQGIYTFGICFFQKSFLFWLLARSFKVIKYPDIARNNGTAQQQSSLIKDSILFICSGWVWSAMTKIIAIPLKKSKYSFLCFVVFIKFFPFFFLSKYKSLQRYKKSKSFCNNAYSIGSETMSIIRQFVDWGRFRE